MKKSIEIAWGFIGLIVFSRDSNGIAVTDRIMEKRLQLTGELVSITGKF
jgi:hypothetical protein